MDVQPILGRLGIRQKFAPDGAPVHCLAPCAHIHTANHVIDNPPNCIFLAYLGNQRTWRKPKQTREELQIGRQKGKLKA